MTDTDIGNKTVLVTGSSGYLGSALVAKLANRAGEIRRFSRGNPRAQSAAPCAAKIVDVIGDVLSPDIWNQVLPGADIVIHLAAQTSSAIANSEPAADLEVNALAMLRMLEACRTGGFRPFIVFAGTVTQAGITPDGSVSENTPDRPITAYDIHKLMAEKYLTLYAEIGHVTGTTLRFSNIYGRSIGSDRGRDRGILDKMIARAGRGEPLSLYDGGSQVRDYLHIDDAMEALILASKCQRRTNGRYFVVGSGTGTALADAWGMIAEIAKSEFGTDVTVSKVKAPSNFPRIDTRDFTADSTAFRDATGWKPEISLAEGIRRELALQASDEE